MVGIVLSGHGMSAPGLYSAMDMIAGERPQVVAVPLNAAHEATFEADLRRALTELKDACGSVLVLTDILGGTPFNQAMLAAYELGGIEVVCGVNMPMLIEVLAARRDDTDLSTLVEVALAAGRKGVVHVPLTAIEASSDVSAAPEGSCTSSR